MTLLLPRSLPCLVVLALAMGPAQAATCTATASARPPAVVELYTSQGCSSCPPADHWLSSLKDQPGVVALAFHVSYWNHLGWADPFATPQTTARQTQLRDASHAPYVYTPQVVLNGVDHRGWRGQAAQALPGLPPGAAPPLRLQRDGNRVLAEVGLPATAPPAGARLAGFWAVLQDEQRSVVTRGENAGATLRNDHVVRLYQPVPAWDAGQAQRHSLPLPAAAGQRVVFVVTQADGLKPVQAAVLQCGPPS